MIPRMKRKQCLSSCLFLPLLALGALLGCGGRDGDSASGGQKLVIGVVAKSQSNPVFQAAYKGALAAAQELGPRHGVEVEIDWQTPPDEDPQKQAEAIEQLARSGARGIAVSCSDANTLTEAINRAVELGALVMTFDSDAPESARFCYFGTDDVTCGKRVMRELAQAMGEKGIVAILAGNQSAPNLQKRVQGVMEELASHPGIQLLKDGVYFHEETPEQAAEAVNRAQTTSPEITGWAMIGGWPLFTREALRWPAGEVKVVAVDALPAQLPYVESGHVEVLLAQDCFGWGYRSVEVLLMKLLEDKLPEGAPLLFDPLTPVRKADVADFNAKWAKWLGGE